MTKKDAAPNGSRSAASLRYRMRLAERGGMSRARRLAPWTTLTEFFERLTNHDARAGNLREEEMRLAAAALLVHAAVIDGEVAAEERRKLSSCCRSASRLAMKRPGG